MRIKYILSALLLALVYKTASTTKIASNVIELNDRFMDVQAQGLWLIKVCTIDRVSFLYLLCVDDDARADLKS